MLNIKSYIEKATLYFQVREEYYLVETYKNPHHNFQFSSVYFYLNDTDSIIFVERDRKRNHIFISLKYSLSNYPI